MIVSLNSQNDPNINLVCEDDKCRLACGQYEPGRINGYKLNHSDKSGLDYCKKIDCQIDESKLIFTPARSDNNVICTDGKGNNYFAGTSSRPNCRAAHSAPSISGTFAH